MESARTDEQDGKKMSAGTEEKCKIRLLSG